MDKTRKTLPSPTIARVRRQRRKPVEAEYPLAPRGRELGAGTEPRFAAFLSHDYPLRLCAVNSGYANLGLAVLFVARRIGESVLCAHFVVDLIASGVTECYGEAFDEDGFAGYIAEMDGRVHLESCDDATASAILVAGLARGRESGIAPPDALDHWARLLPPSTIDSAAAEARVFAGSERPMAVGEMITSLARREARAALRDGPEPLCVVRAPSRLEH